VSIRAVRSSAVLRRLALLVAALLTSSVMLATGASPAMALCGAHAAEHGNWTNVDANTRGIARIELRDCQAVQSCSGGVCSITHDAGWTMRVLGKCSPTNCDWGWSKSQFRLGSGQIPGYYDQGFARRQVYAKMSQYRPGQLWVLWRTDFVDPARADYERQEWFTKVP
jgi:hypothetical protein